MNKLVELNKEKYDIYVKNHPTKSHFLQSYAWGQFAKKEKKQTPYYMGLVDEDDNILAAALLLEKKLPLGYSYFYSPRGFVIDFTNEELLREFSLKIIEFSKKKKGIFIKIDPDVIYKSTAPDGNVIKLDYDVEQIFKSLKKIGFKHQGFNKRFEKNQPRYTFRLDLDKPIEEIKNSFHSTTKKIINKGNIFELNVYKNDKKYIDDFYTTMIETSKRENITQYSKDYYEHFYEILHLNDSSDIYLVEANITKLKEQQQDKISNLKSEIERLTSESKKQELSNQIAKIEKTLSELNEIKEERLPLSSIITAKYGNKVWTMHGGNHTKLRGLNANYLIYFEIIKDAVKEGYEVIDFFGTTFNPSKDDPEYGIHLFKQRLNGNYIEFIGEFDYVLNPFMYFCFTKLVPMYRKLIKRRIRKKQLKK